MFELAGDLGLLKEPASHPAVLEKLGPKRFQGHIPVELLVVGQPHAADPALRMEPPHRIAGLRRRAVRSRRRLCARLVRGSRRYRPVRPDGRRGHLLARHEIGGLLRLGRLLVRARRQVLRERLSRFDASVGR